MNQDFAVVEGDNFVADLAFADDGGTAIDLTGISAAEFTVAGGYDGDSPAALQLTLVSGISVPTPTNGVIKISSPTITLAPRKYVYDFAYTLGGVKTTWMRGTFEVLPEVTP